MQHERDEQPSPEPVLLAWVTLLACETLLRDGYHLPTVIVDGEAQVVVAQIAELAPSHELRVSQLYAAGLVLGREGRVGRLRRVFFVSEGWMSVAQEGRWPEVMPSADPRRREVLAIAGYEVSTGEMRMNVVEMVRDGAGELRDLRPVEPLGGGEERAESPLLAAFVAGFSVGRSLLS